MTQRKYGQGWFNESRRHSLARMGVKTGRKINYNKLTDKSVIKKESAFKFTNEYEDVIKTETLKQFLKETGFEYDDIKNIREEEDGILSIEVGSQEWTLFESDDKAEKLAKERVADDLENEPGLFSQDWLSHFISLSDTDRRMIADDMASSYTEGIRDEDGGKRLIEEADMEDEYDEIQDEIDKKESRTTKLALKKDNTVEKKEECDILDKEVEKLESKKEELLDKAQEELHEKMYDDHYDRLEDPYRYFVDDEGIYTPEDFFKLYGYAIDIDEASEDAVNVDGWQHFLCTYDGNSTELPDGSVICRTN